MYIRTDIRRVGDVGTLDVEFRELAPSFAPFRSYTGKISTCIRGVRTVAS